MPSLILSLTTIPTRVEHLDKLLRSVEGQSLKPDRIELNLPGEYQKRDFGTVDRRQIPSDFDVFDCEDFGPATKIIPTLNRHNTEDPKIVYCDDDRVYHKDWLNRLCSVADNNPNCAVADECNSISAIEYRFNNPVKDWKYRAKRVASLGFYDPYKSSRRNEWDVVEGFGGVLVRPSFFSEQVTEIPESVWAVDDIWLSANLLAQGTGIRWTQRKSSERSRSLRVDGKNLGRMADALTLSTFEGMDRTRADYFAVKTCREHLGVWKQSVAAE